MSSLPQSDSLPITSSNALPSIRDLMHRSITIFRNRMRLFLVLSVATSLFAILMDFSIEESLSFFSAYIPSMYIYALPSWIMWLDSILPFVWLLLSIVCSAALATAVVNEHTTSVRTSLKQALSLLPSFFWIGALILCIVIGGLLFFIIPGIILGISISFATFILIEEKLTGLKAIQRSQDYVRGNWWNIFKRYIVFYILYLFLVMLVGLLKAFSMLPGFFIETGYFVLGAFFAPIFMIYMFQIYQTIKSQKGHSVMIRNNMDTVLLVCSVAGLVITAAFLIYFGSIVTPLMMSAGL